MNTKSLQNLCLYSYQIIVFLTPHKFLKELHKNIMHRILLNLPNLNIYK